VLKPLEVALDADRAAARAASRIAEWLREAIAERGIATLALSGGTTPGAMIGKLADQEVDWTRVHIFQVDERVVSAEDASRNLKGLLDTLSTWIVQSSRVHAMPVEETDLEHAAARYSALLDVVQLGLGADGHTASLVPGDAALDADSDVATTGAYHGLRRMTLTFPTINRARRRLFLVTGGAKRAALRRLEQADATLVAARVASEETLIVADEEAGGGLA